MRIVFFAVFFMLAIIPVSAQTSAQTNPPATNPLLGHNLIRNGDAEQETNSMWAPSWEPAGTLEEAAYGQKPGEWRKGVQGAPHGGCCYLRIEWDDKQTSKVVFQTIDLSSLSNDIDGGKVWAYASGYLGGMVDGGTTLQLSVSWLDVAGKELDTLKVSAVMPMDLRHAFTGYASLVQRQGSGIIPRGTRKAIVRLTGSPTKESQVGYLALADNLSLSLSEINAPQ